MADGSDGNGAAVSATRCRFRTRCSVPQLIFGDLWEYDPAPESADPKIKPRYELFIGGKFVAPKSGKYFDSINPATEKFSRASRSQTRDDVTPRIRRAERRTIQSGGRCRPGAREVHLSNCPSDTGSAREFAVRETMDGGKPIKESRDFDVPMAQRISSITRLGGQARVRDSRGQRQPLGVVGQVIPWNFRC
jgi:aldehyde dehydrogenase (NAD+)